MFEKHLKKASKYFYFVARIAIGIMFLGHGLMKFGLLGGKAAALFSMFWFAGAIETVVGTLVVIGLFTSAAAALGTFQMIAAYFIAHYPKGMSPYSNGGELALLYLFAFVALAVHGGGEISLDSHMKKKKK